MSKDLYSYYIIIWDNDFPLLLESDINAFCRLPIIKREYESMTVLDNEIDVMYMLGILHVNI